MSGFHEKLFDVCITSPPYKEKDGYSDELMIHCFREVYRVLTDDSLFFLNFGHLAEDKFRPFRVCSYALGVGFKLNDTIVWRKNHYKPIQGHKRLNNLTEFIFLLYKGNMPKLNRLAIGIPYVDASNAKRFAEGRNLKCRGNVWDIDYPTINSSEEKPHPDMFPPELPELCLKLCGWRDHYRVLDPFAGAGTVIDVAKKLNYVGVGIEIKKELITEQNKEVSSS